MNVCFLGNEGEYTFFPFFLKQLEFTYLENFVKKIFLYIFDNNGFKIEK
jgi:hypothetical protein